MKDKWIGTALLLASALTTTVREQRLLRSTQSLEEGQRVAVALKTPVARAENDGRLVHLSGRITTAEAAAVTPSAESATTRTPFVLDLAFGIAARGVRLYRTVEMYQWVESSHVITSGSDDFSEDDRTGHATESTRERTYTYELRWQSERVDSDAFHDPSYRNPQADAWVYESRMIGSPEPVAVGEFELSEALLNQIQRRDVVPLDDATRRTMRNVLNQRLGSDWFKQSALGDVRAEGSYFHVTHQDQEQPPATAVRPRLGDLRISFKVIPPYAVTICAKQEAKRLVAFQTKVGEELLLLEDGIHSIEELFGIRLATNYRHNRFFRLFSGTLGFLGFLVLRPTLLRRIGPSLDHVQQHLSALIMSVALTFSVAGLNWFLHRPLWALVLWLGGLTPSIFLVGFLRHRSTVIANAKSQ